MKFSKQISETDAPPVMEARRWLDETTLSPDYPLLNVSQAAPIEAPPDSLRAAMARALVSETSTHLYGPVLGLPALRKALAEQISQHYGGQVSEHQVGITSGCNQAFAAAISTLCDAGDEVLLPTPWYFNHKMWLDMCGVRAVPLPTSDSLIPDIDAARMLMSPNVKAIVLVTPNNPGGIEYPSDVVDAFYDLARVHDISLIVDETYRDFDSRSEPPHSLFQHRIWDQSFIHLYSFSKAYRLTGHRVGALVTHPNRLAQAEKFLDSVSICPSQIGQRGALHGINHLGQWVAQEREEILNRRSAIESQFATLKARGWGLLGLGAYFAYVRHPFNLPSDELAQLLLKQAGILCLPGTMFRPADDARGKQELRIAFANIDENDISTLFARLAAVVGDGL